MFNKKVTQIFLPLIVFAVVLSSCSSSDTKYEKDLSSIFNVSFDANIEDIIALESSLYGHSEYKLDEDGYGRVMLGFAPYTQNDGTTYSKHIYRFDPDTGKLQVIEYGTVADIHCHDFSNTCIHVEELKNAVSTVSQNWDEKNSNGSLTIYGNINEIKCKITYSEQSGFISLTVME